MKTSMPTLLRLLATTSLALVLSAQALADAARPKVGLVLGGCVQAGKARADDDGVVTGCRGGAHGLRFLSGS